MLCCLSLQKHAQVLKGIARCLVAEGQLEEAEQKFQKAMGMENARNPGASRAMLEYCQVRRFLPLMYTVLYLLLE